jgi:poly [ADP-ribose] polymerase
MFGDGLYFSDQSTKALNYATNFWRGGGSTRRIFMFLADVAMGKAYTPSGWGRDFPRKGYDSTFAKGGKSSVSNNEMIVYKTNQANLKYLIEFE